MRKERHLRFFKASTCLAKCIKMETESSACKDVRELMQMQPNFVGSELAQVAALSVTSHVVSCRAMCIYK